MLKKSFKNFSLLLYFFFSILLSEILLKIAIADYFSFLSLIYLIIYSLSFASILFFIIGALRGKLAYYLSFIMLLFLSFLYGAQLVTYRMLRIFFSIFSLSKGGQVVEFWQDIVNTIIKTFHWHLLFFTPSIAFLFLKKKFLKNERLNLKSFSLILILIIMLNVLPLGLIYSSGSQPNSPYDLYLNSGDFYYSAHNFGVLKAISLDSNRNILNNRLSLLKLFKAPEIKVKISDKFQEEVYLHDIRAEKGLDDDENSLEAEANIIHIDFDEMAKKRDDQSLEDMDYYFKNREPSYKNDYTGVYEGYNLILITAESFSKYAVDKDLTPTLYKMVEEGFDFTNFYNPLWETSTLDGEYVALTGLLPKRGVWSLYVSSDNFLPFLLGNQLKDLGYETKAYHNHTYDYYRRDLSHPNMGYEYKGIGNGLKMSDMWPRSDLEMMEVSLPEYIDSEPFHSYYMTISGHMQYNFKINSMAIKNRELVENLNYSEAAKAYMATQIELDRALEYLLEELDEKGVLDRTLIALSADHYPYALKDSDIEDLLGHKLEKNFDLYKSTFILYTKDMEAKTIDKPCSSLDILPTLSNLLGLEYDSRLVMGRDIFSDSESLVVFLNKSFICDQGRYDASKNIFYPSKDSEVDEAYLKDLFEKVEDMFKYSSLILDEDYYNQLKLK